MARGEKYERIRITTSHSAVRSAPGPVIGAPTAYRKHTIFEPAALSEPAINKESHQTYRTLTYRGRTVVNGEYCMWLSTMWFVKIGHADRKCEMRIVALHKK